jgi:hypothetical protein
MRIYGTSGLRRSPYLDLFELRSLETDEVLLVQRLGAAATEAISSSLSGHDDARLVAFPLSVDALLVLLRLVETSAAS